nr:copper resistance protein CopD [Actinomycetales bacterium]
MIDGAARIPGSRPGATRRLIWAIPASVLALILALLSTGAADPRALVDPGALVRWGLPIVTVVVRAAGALTIGAFAVAALILRGPTRSPRPTEGDDEARVASSSSPGTGWSTAVRLGQGAAVVWVLGQLAYVVFTYAAVWGRSLSEPTFGDELLFFLSRTELGQTLIAETVLAVIVSVLAVATGGMVTAMWTAVMGALALAPVALTGHAAGAANHNLAVSSMWLHLVPLGLWAGGLAAMVAVYRRLGPELERAAARYSALALWCFVLVGGSGVFASVIRLNGPADLVLTPWGRLLLVKILLWALLGWIGWDHRRRTIPQLAERPGLFLRLAAVEVAVMGAVMGVAV